MVNLFAAAIMLLQATIVAIIAATTGAIRKQAQ
jgi:hypothetical protein